MSKSVTARIMLISSMCIFGTIGIFARYIPLSSALIALVRGGIGALFLLIVCFLSRKGIALDSIKRNLLLLLISGACIGFNWVLLFEAYRFTTVATATLCYYTAPLFVMILSPLVLKEKLTWRKCLCIPLAICGMIPISGILEADAQSISDTRGILCGIGAALFYATVMLLNKKIKNVPARDKTVVQLASAAIVMIPYCLLTNAGAQSAVSPTAIIILLIVAVVHTGITYALYFGSMEYLPAQTTAIYSYIDPVVAIILSAVLLKESFGWAQTVGTVCILGAAFLSELPYRK